MSLCQHSAFIAFLSGLQAASRHRTATSYDSYLARLEGWMRATGIDPLRASTDDLRCYQMWIAETCRRQADGKPLARTTQLTCILVVRSCYAWLAKHGHLLHDPAAALVLPRVPRSLTVAKDHLSQQEAQALIETAEALAHVAPHGTSPWAIHARNLALVAIAIATGRRCHGLVSLRISDLDRERDELRVALEKSKMGRVLPVANWAMVAIDRYLAGPRDRLLNGASSSWLFVSQRAEQLSARGFAFVLDTLVAETIRRNPDLAELSAKRISTHSLRVSFAKMLHDHGCNIRSLNELMLHRSLETTAQYTPVSVNDLRRAILPLHPRA
jgi:site-specific recombinase XerD